MANSKRSCRFCKARRPIAEMQIIKGAAYCIDGEHAYQYAIRASKRAQDARKRRARAEAKEKIKTRSDWLREAQAAVNKYVRVRDAGKPCVSCDRPDDKQHQRHASHYRSVGACSSLRFDTRNIFASCAQCNNHQSGNILEYRIRLVKRFGESRVAWLESQNAVQKYDIEYLRRLKRIFSARARHVERMRDEKSATCTVEKHPQGCR